MAQEEQQGGTAQVIQGVAEGKIPKRLKKQMQGYKTVLSKLMHSKDTRKGTMDILKSGPAEVSVPQAALAINGQAEQLMERKGMKLTSEVKLAGAVFLVGDLVDLGNAGAQWEAPVDEKETTAIFQDTLQDYIHRGLKDGSIDPIELQQSAEPLLNDEQQQMGQQLAMQNGVPMAPTEQQILGNQKGILGNRGGKANGS